LSEFFFFILEQVGGDCTYMQKILQSGRSFFSGPLKTSIPSVPSPGISSFTSLLGYCWAEVQNNPVSFLIFN
jgi:hypothetical protein